MLPAEASKILGAYVDGLTSMRHVLEANLGRAVIVGNHEYGARVAEVRDAITSVRLMRHMVTRGATMVDLDKLTAGGEVIYLLLTRRHFQLLDRFADPTRFRGERSINHYDGHSYM